MSVMVWRQKNHTANQMIEEIDIAIVQTVAGNSYTMLSCVITKDISAAHVDHQTS